MIAINFKCEACGGNKGHLEVYADEPMIECDNPECGEAEPIKEFDIVGNDY